MRTYIWSLPTRLSHWLVVIALVVAYILGGEEEYINTHVAFGYLAGTLVLFRIIWGIFGPRYSRFSDFPVGIGKIKEFVTNMKSTKLKYPGHNPAASLIMISILIIILLVVFSGLANLASEGQGLLTFLNLPKESEFFEEAHEVMVNILIALVIIHLLGIAVDTIFNVETGTLASILTGYKKLNAERVRLNAFQKVLGIVWITGALTLFSATITSQNLKLNDSEKETEDGASQNMEDEEVEED
jgi:cytochrome b